jgi:hypothetical protein
LFNDKPLHNGRLCNGGYRYERLPLAAFLFCR